MFDIITKENEVAFNEKIELDDEVSVVNSPKKLSAFEIARARKARGDRRRKAALRHRGQRDGKLHYKRDEKAYSHESIAKATPSNFQIIRSGVDDYFDDLKSQTAKAEAIAEAKANKEEYLRYLKEERRNALITAAWYLEKAYSLDYMIAGLEDDN